MKTSLLKHAVGFLALMAFDTAAQVCFKLAGAHAFPPEANPAWVMRLFAAPWIYGALIGYVGAFFTWMSLLERAPIGPAFAVSQMEVISVMLVSAIFFGEHIGPGKALGAAIIVAGIVCLAAGERSASSGNGRNAADRGIAAPPS
ncbi:MAG TPA: EamA family transporter [Xanthomonadaceae bacterium]|jgi:drug/metabolite transporter (DMT)-like permease